MKNKTPIYIVIGTRAQLVKVAPVMLEMDRQGIKYKYINSAQHLEMMEDVRKNNFKLKKPDYILKTSSEANTFFSFFKWILKAFLILIFERKKIIPQKGLLITHGDTVTALWSAILGKLSGCKVMHLESGLRSFNLLAPFPEEIVRLLIFKLTDIYVCPNSWAKKNLKKYKGVKIDTKINILYDSIQIALKNTKQLQFKEELPKKFALVTVHRFKNLFDENTLNMILNIIDAISKKTKILFILHPPTEKRLNQLGIIKKMEKNKNIIFRKRFSFFDFIKVINKAEFVATDGGSNQEELFYLGKPTLILRKTTERVEGLKKTALLSEYRLEKVEYFLNNYQKFKGRKIKYNFSPSKIVVNYIRKNFVR